MDKNPCVTRDLRAGDYERAARGIHRAATHAATAAAVHWHHRHYSWRRLTTVLAGLVYDGRMGYRHLRAFRELIRLPCMLADADEDVTALRRLLRRARRRVLRLYRAVWRAMASDPDPLSLQDYLALLAADSSAGQREPDPEPITTMGEYRRALGLYVAPGEPRQRPSLVIPITPPSRQSRRPQCLQPSPRQPVARHTRPRTPPEHCPSERAPPAGSAIPTTRTR